MSSRTMTIEVVKANAVKICKQIEKLSARCNYLVTDLPVQQNKILFYIQCLEEKQWQLHQIMYKQSLNSEYLRKTYRLASEKIEYLSDFLLHTVKAS